MAVFNGTAGSDTLTGSDGDDTINGMAGDDVLTGLGGADVVNAGTGDDRVDGGDGDDTLSFTGGTGSVVSVAGGAGRDLITHGSDGVGEAAISGGAGDDVIRIGRNGAYIIDGGEGFDDLYLTGVPAQLRPLVGVERLNLPSTALTVSTTLINSVQVIASRSYANPPTQTFGALNLTLADAGVVNLSGALASSVVIRAAAAGNTITTGTGGDDLTGGAGPDVLRGGEGDDGIVGGGGSDHLEGGGGNDTLSQTTGAVATGVHRLDGGAGDDAVSINLTNFQSVDIIGGAGADRLSVFVQGTFSPTAGPVRVDGGAGTDVFTISNITEVLQPKLVFAGIEELRLSPNSLSYLSVAQVAAVGGLLLPSGSSTGALVLRLTDGGDADLSRAAPTGGVRVTASTAGNRISGTIADDELTGGAGDDVLLGGAGDDVLNGAADGFDQLLGGDGDDRLTVAGRIAFVVDGGAGLDTWTLSNADRRSTTALSFSNADFRTATGVTLPSGGIVRNVEAISYAFGNADDTYIGVPVPAGLSDNINLGGGSDRARVTFGGVTTIAGRSLAFVSGEQGSLRDEIVIDASGFGAGLNATSSVFSNQFGSFNSFNLFVGPIPNSATDRLSASGFSRIEVTGTRFGDVLSGQSGGVVRPTVVSDQGVIVTRIDESVESVLVGGGGNDRFVSYAFDRNSSAPNDRLDGGEGDDTLELAGEVNEPVTIDLGLTGQLGFRGSTLVLTGIENVVGTRQNDTLRGDAASNALSGGEGADVLIGRAGNDRLEGGNGADSLEGGEGDDDLFGGAGADRLAGGTGRDRFRYASLGDSVPGSEDVLIDFESGLDVLDATALNATSASITLLGAQTLIELTAGSLRVLIRSDRLIATSDIVGIVAAPPQTLTGGDPAETLAGGAGDDVITGLGGADSLTGGAGADTFRYTSVLDSRPDGFDIISDFATGADRIDFGPIAPIQVSLIRNGAATFVFAQIAGGGMTIAAQGEVNGRDLLGFAGGVFVIGDEGANTLIGSDRPDTIQGRGGDDVIIGGGGGDPLFGEAGADTFRYLALSDSTAAGSDGLFGFETGVDRVDLTALSTGEVSLIRSGGATFLFARSATGAFQLASLQDLNVSDLVGVNHGVFVIGSATGDTVRGGGFADVIQTGDGADTIFGGGGADLMFGGAGADVFSYANRSDSTLALADTVFDFANGVDRIDLRGVRTGAADRFGVVNSGPNSFLFVDLGGDGVNDMLIQLQNVALQTGDVLF